MATFIVRFLGCKVSHADAQAIRERLLARRPRRGGSGADVAVVNTCCVTHEAVSKSRQAAAPRGTHARRVYVTGCGANLAGDAFAGLPENVVVVARTERGDAGVRRRRRRRDRLRAGRRAARPRPRVREDPGRLQLLVQLLRDPARARRRRAAAAPTAVLREVAPPRRAGPSRGRAHRHQPRLLPRPRGRLRPAAARARGRRDARARAPAALVDRGQPRERRARRGAARDADRRAPPARPAPVGRRRRAARDGPPLHGRDVPAPARAARGLQPHDRRDRRLPRRGRARVRADAARRSRGRADEGARLSVLAAAGHGDGGRRPCPAGREEGAQRAAARRLARGVPARAGARSSARRTSCSSTGPGAATATTTRPWLVDGRRSASSCACAPRRSRRRESSLS